MKAGDKRSEEKVERRLKRRKRNVGQSKGEIRENDRCSPETLFNCREYSMSAGGCSLTGFMYVCVCVCQWEKVKVTSGFVSRLSCSSKPHPPPLPLSCGFRTHARTAGCRRRHSGRGTARLGFGGSVFTTCQSRGRKKNVQAQQNTSTPQTQNIPVCM